MADIETTKISSKGQITIPQNIRRIFKIKTGQTFTFQARKEGILLKPVDLSVVDLTKSKEWDASLKAGLADLKAGRAQRFDSEEAFMKHLKELEVE